MLFVLFMWSALAIALVIFTKSVYRHAIILLYLHRLPSPPSSRNPLLGNMKPMFDTQEKSFKLGRKWAKEYYPIYLTWAAHKGSANIFNSYDFETVLSATKHNKKSGSYDTLHKWLGTGLLTSEGIKWQQRRKMLTNSFHFNILQDFIKIFNEEAEHLVDIFKKECDKPFISITDYISDFTLNTIGETAMGTNFNKEGVRGTEYKKSVRQVSEMVLHRMGRPWLSNNFLYFFSWHKWKENQVVKILHDFAKTVIEKREKNFKPVNVESSDFSYSKRKRLAMLDLLLTVKNEDGSIDDEGIREEVDTFMFEGHDTTSAAICFALLLIACHPEIQDRIVEEIQQVIPDATKPDYKVLQELKYMERCIKEIIRIYPPVAGIGRVLGEDITTYSGHHLKAGTMVTLKIFDLHHNPDVFPDPEKFDPDRFLPENSQNRHPYAYVPFSAGPRNCIGQKFAMLEIKSVLCGILSEFVLEPVDTPSTITLLADLVLRTKENIKVKFVPRSPPLGRSRKNL